MCFQCFFCPSEESFDGLCLALSARLIRGHAAPLFEIRESAPPFFTDEYTDGAGGDNDGVDKPTMATASGSDDDEFEML